jgi:hypothetical protein
MRSLLILFTTLVSFAAVAQRVPDSLSHGLYVSSEGFELNPAKTEWIKSTSPVDLENKIEALFRMKNEKALSQPTFTIRIDKDTPYKTLKGYSKKWLKNYGQFGLEVLGHQYFKNKKNQSGFVIDIANSTSHKKLRQVIFFKNAKAVILTCMDQKDSFKTSLKSCNDLIKTFSWDDSELSDPEILSK